MLAEKYDFENICNCEIRKKELINLYLLLFFAYKINAN